MKRTFILSMILIMSFLSKAQLTTDETPYVSFSEDYSIVSEDDGYIEIVLEISEVSSGDASVDVSVLGDFDTAIPGLDFTFTPGNYTFPAGSSSLMIHIPIIDNAEEHIDKLFVLSLSNPVNCELDEPSASVVFILDDEETAPEATNDLEIEFASSYLVDPDGSAEIVAFNKPLKRLYVMNSEMSYIEILDFSDPRNIAPISTIDLSAYGSGGTSVACNNAIVAATVAGQNHEDDGSVIFMNKNGTILNMLTVGNGPDMICFTPDNHYVLIANEGEPSDEYTLDPEGTISVIDISDGVEGLTDDDVVHIDFHDFNDDIDALRAQGVRIFGLNATVSQDFEPEYITVSEDSRMAWVSLQENNALATLDLETMTVTGIIPLGLKDHSLAENSLDVSDRNDSIFMASWDHLKGMYLPDAIASYTVDGITYVVTANEGDQREYGVIDEDVKVKDDIYVLDSDIFPNADLLKENYLLGRLAVTPYSGDFDGDGDFDEIHAFGARSFSIWNTETGDIVFDSGNDFEKITALDPVFGELFNASNSNNNFKNRSDNKGPEPEGITVAMINEKYYAFITLERVGGVMVYDVTDPSQAEFVSYKNSRTLGDDEGGDLGPEGIIYINPKESPVDTGLIVMANEVSSTLSVYYIMNDVKKKGKGTMKDAPAQLAGIDKEVDSPFIVAPNPASTSKVQFNKQVSYSVYNSSGSLIGRGENKDEMDISNFQNGMYFVITPDRQSFKLVVKK